MCNDRVTSIYYLGVVTAFIEHTHINSQVVCQVYSTVHSAFIRADDHQMIFVDLSGLIMSKQCLYKLISWHEVVKSVQRDGILYSWVMSIKSNNVFNAHLDQLF